MATDNDNSVNSNNGKKSFESILDELITKHLLNLPEDYIKDKYTFMFYIEQAHWGYQDDYLEHDVTLMKYDLTNFTCRLLHQLLKRPAKTLFENIYRPYLTRVDFKNESVKSEDNIDINPNTSFNVNVNFNINDYPNIIQLCDDYKKFVKANPVCGAIIMTSPNKDVDNNTSDGSIKVLVVRSYLTKNWSFPKGKTLVHLNELDVDCAAREVKEETGLDVSKLIDPNKYIELFEGVNKDENIRRTRLYIIEGVDPSVMDIKIQTVKEISDVKWMALEEIPRWSGKIEKGTKMFIPLARFIKPLLKWLNSSTDQRQPITIYNAMKSVKRQRQQQRRSQNNARLRYNNNVNVKINNPTQVDHDKIINQDDITTSCKSTLSLMTPAKRAATEISELTDLTMKLTTMSTAQSSLTPQPVLTPILTTTHVNSCGIERYGALKFGKKADQKYNPKNYNSYNHNRNPNFNNHNYNNNPYQQQHESKFNKRFKPQQQQSSEQLSTYNHSLGFIDYNGLYCGIRNNFQHYYNPVYFGEQSIISPIVTL